MFLWEEVAIKAISVLCQSTAWWSVVTSNSKALFFPVMPRNCKVSLVWISLPVRSVMFHAFKFWRCRYYVITTCLCSVVFDEVHLLHVTEEFQMAWRKHAIASFNNTNCSVSFPELHRTCIHVYLKVYFLKVHSAVILFLIAGHKYEKSINEIMLS